MAMIYSTSEHEASPGCCAYHDAQAKDAEIASLRAEVAKLRAEGERLTDVIRTKSAELARLRAESEERERALRGVVRLVTAADEGGFCSICNANHATHESAECRAARAALRTPDKEGTP